MDCAPGHLTLPYGSLFLKTSDVDSIRKVVRSQTLHPDSENRANAVFRTVPWISFPLSFFVRKKDSGVAIIKHD